jgi:ketosteroid isomerase-like protein
MKLVVVLLTLLMLPAFAHAQKPPTDRDHAIEDELRGLVKAWDEAYVKRDTATLDRLLANEFAFVGGPNKAGYLASFKTGDFQVDSAVSTDIQVQVYDDAAVLTGLDTITGKNKGQTFVTKWLYLDVWVKRKGKWQCVKTYSMPAPKANFVSVTQ